MMSGNLLSADARTYTDADGTVYLTGGRNRVLDLYDDVSFMSNVHYEYWPMICRSMKEKFEKIGIKWRIMFFPEKLNVYGDHLLARHVNDKLAPPVRRMLEFLAGFLVTYPIAALQSARSERPTYPKTDSHWTSWGASVAFRAFMAEAGIDVGDLFSGSRLEEVVAHGDLWEPGLPPDRVEKPALPSSVRRMYCNAGPALLGSPNLSHSGGLHVGCCAVYANSKALFDKTVMIFGSSFTSYDPKLGLLLHYFTRAFSAVHFIWSANLDWDYIETNEPDAVFIEMPERFPVVCPPDDFNVADHSLSKVRRYQDYRASHPV